MLEELEQSGVSVAGRLRFGPVGASIRVFADSTQSHELDDIRTVEDNEAVAEFFMETNVTDDLAVQLLTDSGEFNVSGQVVNLSPNEFLLYLYFARRVRDGHSPLGGYLEIRDGLQDLNEAYRQPENFSHWTHKALSNYDPTEDPRKWASSIRGKLKAAGFDNFQVERLVPHNGHLAIELPKESVSIEA